GYMVSDVIDTSRARLDAAAPESAEAIRHLGRPVIAFSDDMWIKLKEIRQFLFTRMYRAPSVMEIRTKVTQVVTDLFPIYMQDPSLLPQRWRQEIEAVEDEAQLARLVCDYIAGMTDRFALQSHARLMGVDILHDVH
ncbi:deoxyguanosinetriphosphate triphosphohydrolase, partial [Salipiger sp. HF18]|nr:deoxyguanosinetriphosphate triphosphohydrolase [Salipiger sp. HF18]